MHILYGLIFGDYVWVYQVNNRLKFIVCQQSSIRNKLPSSRIIFKNPLSFSVNLSSILNSLLVHHLHLAKPMPPNQFDQTIYKMDPLPPLATCLFHKSTKPSQQTFMQMIRLTFFPYFALYSFTFFYLILITFVFSYSLSWHTQQYDNPHMIETQFLKVSQKALFELGENYPYYILRKYHYYRLLTSMVLFRNFYHFVLCAIGIVVLGSYIEAWVGFKRVFVLVFTSGAAGQLFGNLLTDQAKLQSSSPIVGMIGYLIGVFVMHRKKQWRDYENQKNHMLMMLIASIGTSLSLAFIGLFLWQCLLYNNVSLYSQVAALIFGFIFYFSDQKHIQFGVKSVMVIIVLCGIMGILIVLFFLYADPQRVYR